MTLAIILACVIVGLFAWDRLVRFRAPRHDEAPLHSQLRLRRVETPRFKGNGTVPFHVAAMTGRPISPRRTAATDVPIERFQGTRRRDPNAIGVACGRPISECTRGDECLCVD